MNKMSAYLALSTIVTATVLCTGCAAFDYRWTELIDARKTLAESKQAGKANWRFEDGTLIADSRVGKEGAFLILPHSYGDFAIRAEFWASDDANSGLYLRCASAEKITDKDCYEVNIFDQRPDPTYGTGAIVHVARVAPMPKAGGRWNTFDIVFQGERLQVTLNGVRTVDVIDSKFKSGPMALQYAGGVIKFRSVKIRQL